MATKILYAKIVFNNENVDADILNMQDALESLYGSFSEVASVTSTTNVSDFVHSIKELYPDYTPVIDQDSWRYVAGCASADNTFSSKVIASNSIPSGHGEGIDSMADLYLDHR